MAILEEGSLVVLSISTTHLANGRIDIVGPRVSGPIPSTPVVIYLQAVQPKMVSINQCPSRMAKGSNRLHVIDASSTDFSHTPGL